MVHLVQRPKLCSPKPVIDKPTIFAYRHVGLMDPVVLMVEYFNLMLRPLVALDYYSKNSFTRSFFDHAQCIPINRRGGPSRWLEDSIAVLERGECIAIAPEGTRNKKERGLLPFHTGVCVLAAKSGAQIVPVYNAFWHFPHRYRMAIGEPFHLDPVPEEGMTKEWLAGQAAKVQAAVAALEPLVENR